jgi:nucleotide-binding universal stress UspA family protein
MVLICYDGSPDAKAAIEQAGELLDGHPATVLTVWEPFLEVLARTPAAFGMPAGIGNVDEIDNANRKAAEQLAQEGADFANHAGLNAQPRVCARVSSVANAILGDADEVGASAIVMGSRGLGGLSSLLVGSVSHAVIQHADRAVIVVPSPQVSRARGRKRHASHTGT